MKYLLKWVAWILVVIGALNWGLIGFFDYDLVLNLLGTGMVSRVVYDLIGISAIVLIFYKVMKMKKKK